MLFNRFFKYTSWLPMTLVYRLRVTGKENLPQEPYIIVSNHGLGVDPLLINLALVSKRIYFLTAKKLFDCPGILQWMLYQMGCIPAISPVVDADNLYDKAQNLHKNELIGFFSQGKLQNNTEAFKTGAVVLALRTGFPIVPAYVKSKGAFKGKSRVCFGEPLAADPALADNAEGINRLSELVRERVIMLSKE